MQKYLLKQKMHYTELRKKNDKKKRKKNGV